MDTRTTGQNIQDTDLADFDAAWRQVDERLRVLIRVVYGLVGLTRLGERPVEVHRFAAYLDRSAEDTIALLDANSGALFTTKVRDGLITVNLARPDTLRRRTLRIGGRQIAMSGCAPDLFQIAAVIDTPFQVEDTCPATGAPIRVDFTPPDIRADLVDTVEPAEAVVALDPRLLGQTSALTPEQIDANLCVQMPFFVSADAAQGWLAGNPARRVCPVRQLHRLQLIGFVRDVVRPGVTAHLF